VSTGDRPDLLARDQPTGVGVAGTHHVKFEILGEIEQIETIAAGAGVRVRALLNKTYGKGRWRKRKGSARIRFPSGAVRRVELHWYEAHGIGRRDFKIKAYAD
jgi:hypothetical protein